MTDFNPAEVLKGSIPDLTAKFGDFDDAQLQALHDHENGKDGQKRAGMLSALHAEQGNRDLNAKTKAAIEAAAKDGVKLFGQADLDAARAENPDLKALQDQHAETTKGFEDRIAALEADLRKAKGRQPAKAVAAKPRQLGLTGEADFDTSYRIAFTDSQDTTIAGLPELEFGEGDFELDRGTQGRVLTQPITFPEGVSRTEVKKVWLVDSNGKAAAVAELVSALPVGGGHASSIPAKFLAFRKPETTATANEAASEPAAA